MQTRALSKLCKIGPSSVGVCIALKKGIQQIAFSFHALVTEAA